MGELRTFLPLTPDESRHVVTLATEAARRLDTLYVAMDIGQLDGGEWIVIESGDAQFSGVSRIPLLSLWRRIREIG